MGGVKLFKSRLKRFSLEKQPGLVTIPRYQTKPTSQPQSEQNAHYVAAYSQ